MRIRSLAPVLVAFALLLGACFHHSYTVGSGAPNGRVVYSRWHSHWLFGIIGEDNVDVNAVCPSGNATVRNDITVVNGIIGALIGFIYYPTTVEVFCADGGPPAGPPHSVLLTPEQTRKIAAAPEFTQWVAEVAPERVDLAQAAHDAAAAPAVH